MKYPLSKLLALCLLFTAASSLTQGQEASLSQPLNREIAVTFDDLPFASETYDAATQKKLSEKLLGIIKEFNIPAVGFVNEGKIYRDQLFNQTKYDILDLWLMNGLELGNHTYSHKSLNSTPLDEYQQDVIKGETLLKILMKEHGMTLRYFRYPFLQTGKSLGKRDSFEVFLSSHGYVNAPVTVDNSDWIFAGAYDIAKKNSNQNMMDSIAAAYIPYLESKLEYYENQSQKLFGRGIKQILLLHANSINADVFGRVAEMMLRRGYRFISLSEALSDTAYSSPDTFAKGAGISSLHRWAITKGHKRDFFQGEPPAPGFVMKYAGVDEE